MTVSDLQIGYVTGIIDGEGCIYIPKNCGSVYLKVAMGHKPAVQALQQTFNCGTIQDVTPVGYNQAFIRL